MTGRERVAVAVTVVLAAVLNGGGVAVADGPSSGLGRIAYADGELTLDPADGTHVVEAGEADSAAPGWDTTGVPAGVLVGDTVTWSLTGVDGPGDVTVSRSGQDRPLFDSSDDVPDRVEVPVGEQAVTHWEFSEEGTYRLIFEAAGTAAEDGRELSVGTVYTVVVGGDDRPVEPLPAPAPEVRTRVLAAPAKPPRAAAVSDATSDVVSTRTVLDEGHIDFAARVVDDRLQIHVKDGTVPGRTTWREPSSLVLKVNPAAKNTLPDNDAFSFLGRPGTDVWLLDQVQQDGLLWPGWSTDNVGAGALKGGVSFALTGVEGPGAYALYTYDAMSGADVLFNSKDGVPDSFEVPANTHAHGGWAFTKEGTYRLTFRMSGKLADGTAVSDTETVAFVVGDGNADAVRPGGSSSDTPGASDTSKGSSSSSSSSSSSADAGKSGSGTGGSGPSGSMASTGAGSPALLGAAAAGLALAGGGAVWGVRRRRRGV
ncbi:choice-of-anchor M domain-containing protein [Streptomyces sp. S.PB5]|uniref:choice-of-anchor M domain-containing protein n=1 Tax=Streptomyces sp. S.PB5 TaxID=3020844 RepID=UPI0025AEECB7|nr:choice-of-anchor M domain-containing protein [Streptomyces sp. S.PB5]MDN3024412.1 choice-of-anchor M domain-containing protein [Streptomyces sp. S.PB5]